MRPILLGRIYKHISGHKVKIIGFGESLTTGRRFITYKILKTGRLKTESVSSFIKETDKKKYPNVKQKYRFKLIPKKEE